MVENKRRDIADIVREVVGETLRSLSSIVDVEARHGVVDALQKLESHERICGERDKNADEQRKRLECKIDDIVGKLDGKVPAAHFDVLSKKLDGLYRIAWATTVWAMTTMTIALAFFIKRELFP
jgi:hypothetical protein